MAKHNCETCKFRAKYDNNPRSLLGRLWRWHAGWCPGWKAYMASLSDEDRLALAHKYNLPKYKSNTWGSRKNKFAFLSVHALAWQGAKAQAYQDISSFRNAGRWDHWPLKM